MRLIAEFKINSYEERSSLTSILANNGYAVVVEERKKDLYGSDMFVKVYVLED